MLDKEREDGSGSGVINAVGHSMGVAYSVGFIDGLKEAKYPAGHPKEGQPIFSDEDFGEWWALAPYQPKDIEAPNIFKERIQFSSTYDAVTHTDARIKGTTFYRSDPNGGGPAINPGVYANNAKSHGNGNFSLKFKDINLPKFKLPKFRRKIKAHF